MSADSSFEMFKMDIGVTHLENDHRALSGKMQEFKSEDGRPDSLLTFYTGEPRLDFDPITEIEQIKAVIYYAG
jgi:hypothetical protein